MTAFDDTEDRQDWAIRHVRTGGFVTRCLEAGDEHPDTVLLLHDGAWGGSSDVSWSRCIPQLAQRYRVIAPDFLGFGGSDKATFFDRSPYEPRIQQVEDLLDTLGITEPVHVVGTSFGGSVALRLLAGSPDRSGMARSVTSIGGSGGPWKTAVMLEHLGRWDGTKEDLARVLRFLMAEDDGFDAQLAARHAVATRPGHYRAVASAALPVPEPLKQQNTDPWPVGLGGVRVPTMLVAGTEDELFEHDWPERIAQELPEAVVERIESLHSPNLDRPQEVLAVLLRHFRRAEQNEETKAARLITPR
ncbi:alpha/beta fold hydrolase [Kocuria rosea]|uniref:alpha/beta fold hydrolase n=1 Tax=Kocuria rosea TaxID=1275 RepID=UPI00203EF107|nr:alpha/beta hydrolase [Kocuria rosea]